MAEGSARTKVLVVEDEESVRSAIEAGLDVIGGFQACLASDAEDGLRQLKAENPEIVLLDLVMPVTDGMEFLRRMKADPDLARPNRVVLMTALENPVPESNLKELGIDLVLAKPFRLKELANALGAESPF